jgi:hypothetical protein
VLAFQNIVAGSAKTRVGSTKIISEVKYNLINALFIFTPFNPRYHLK